MFLYSFNKEHAFGFLTSEAFVTTAFKTPSKRLFWLQAVLAENFCQNGKWS